ncbi:MAG: hypothetical protein SAJ12_04545 [Jaaginema sp. PMC 1079.18]|nr:hypothetical protein [Jaaginema sp. PMC 1080.18]MEC4850260.1 hypothetical protein [Jaaginema sp. PMC 1079.18]MEC4867183.1 hypothetical protein [Jaaginema sp. PMC 1078.18]
MMTVEQKLQDFEQKYKMKSEDFYKCFQAGKLGDSMDFFEWNTYYEIWVNAESQAL